MNPEETKYLSDVETALREEGARNMDNAKIASSMFQSDENTNLIEWQLEMDNILERIDHLLRGHSLGFTKDGQLIWKEPENSDFAIFNEYGVQEILRILSMYLNRNTILSNYDEPTINWKVYDIGYDLADLIYLKYEQMGLDTPEKQKLYPMLVREIVDTIHSAYLRALHGGERDSLRQARFISQTEPLGGNPGGTAAMIPQGPQKHFNLLKPTTWR